MTSSEQNIIKDLKKIVQQYDIIDEPITYDILDNFPIPYNELYENEKKIIDGQTILNKLNSTTETIEYVNDLTVIPRYILTILSVFGL